jgi:hypothetical protein
MNRYPIANIIKQFQIPNINSNQPLPFPVSIPRFPFSIFLSPVFGLHAPCPKPYAPSPKPQALSPKFISFPIAELRF